MTSQEPRTASPTRPFYWAGCPICGSEFVMRLRDDWQMQVEAGAAIPIVGCGNPWHYFLDRAEAANGSALDANFRNLLRLSEAAGEEYAGSRGRVQPSMERLQRAVDLLKEKDPRWRRFIEESDARLTGSPDPKP